MLNRIFSTDSPKAVKADQYGWLNAIHYMAPHTLGGVGNMCPNASEGCKALCLGHYSGQASMVKDLERDDSMVRKSRRDKAIRFMRDRRGYMADVVQAIEREIVRAIKTHKRLCVRMNGSTDIAWEGIRCERNGVEYANLFQAFPGVQFVDYTKNPRRFNRQLPENYHLTFSRSETNEPTALELLQRGVNVAVVFSPDHAGLYERNGKKHWRAFVVKNGDEHDLRHLDGKAVPGFVIALTPKGRKAKRDMTGFIVR